MKFPLHHIASSSSAYLQNICISHAGRYGRLRSDRPNRFVITAWSSSLSTAQIFKHTVSVHSGDYMELGSFRPISSSSTYWSGLLRHAHKLNTKPSWRAAFYNVPRIIKSTIDQWIIHNQESFKGPFLHCFIVLYMK